MPTSASGRILVPPACPAIEGAWCSLDLTTANLSMTYDTEEPHDSSTCGAAINEDGDYTLDSEVQCPPTNVRLQFTLRERILRLKPLVVPTHSELAAAARHMVASAEAGDDSHLRKLHQLLTQRVAVCAGFAVVRDRLLGPECDALGPSRLSEDLFDSSALTQPNEEISNDTLEAIMRLLGW